MTLENPVSNGEIPPLTHLKTLTSPSGRGIRAWSSNPHSSSSTPLLATASSDKSVNIWSLRDFRLLSTISGGHKRSVRCVGWKDYGTKRKNGQNEATQEKPATLATGSFDANVGIWIHNDRNHTKDVGEETDPDEIDVTKSEEDEDEEWHFSTLLTGPDSEIKSLAFSPAHYSANMLATSSRDKSVWVWEEVEEDEWETIAVLAEHAGDVKCVAWCEGARRGKRRRLSTGEDSNGDENDEDDLVGRRELLASGSYDDTIRLWRDIEEEGDWGCVTVIEGHKGTVWDVCWEKWLNPDIFNNDNTEEEILWEPRLLSCSDDLKIKVWRREYSEAELEKRKRTQGNAPTQKLPSIIRPTGSMEKWVEDSELPLIHVRSVYAVDWSRHTGLVVSCGGDGTIAVYKEVRFHDEDVVMNGTEEHNSDTQTKKKHMKWIIVAMLEIAHDEYEINHVCWAERRDPGRRFDGEEIIVSTADDGDVKLWCLPEDLLQ